jgi:ADP-heptose:LPS heptosyltransferase
MIKFLVIRFSSIGDIVLTTPLIRCLKNQVEGAEIIYLTKSEFASILQSNPYISKVITLERSLSETIRLLKKENVDYIIDLHRNMRSFRVKSSLRRLSYSLNKINIRKWVLVNFKKNILPAEHIVDRYLKTARIFSVENDNKGLDYFIPGEDEIDPGKINQGIKKPFMIVAVGGGHTTKQIPIEKIKQICHDINVDIVLLGGKEDMNKAAVIEADLSSKQLHNLTGKLSINQSASLIRQSSLVVTPDTGIMHIAAAFKKNILSVWGNTIPEFGMYPYQPGEYSEIFEVAGLSCRPCSKIGFQNCPKKHFRCMEQQDYIAITRKIKNLLTVEK